LAASEQESGKNHRHDTPGGPITGNRVVPSSWQKTPQGGPMIMAGDRHLTIGGLWVQPASSVLQCGCPGQKRPDAM